MVIGFDASRAFVGQRTGTENYSYQLLKALLKIDRKNLYRIYVNPYRLNAKIDLINLIPALPAGRSKETPRTKSQLDHSGIGNFLGELEQLEIRNFEFKAISWPRLWTQGGLALECLLNPPDVLFIPAHTLPVIRRPNLRTVVTIHDLGGEYLQQYHQFPQKYYLNWSTVYAVKNATRIIAVSESTKQDLITKLYFDTEVIRVIYEGVDTRKFQISNFKFQKQKILQKYKIEKPYILFVGTIQPRKNLVRLIKAFSRILRDKGNLSLILAGKPGWLYKEIYGAPKKFGVEDRVKFLNFVQDEDLAILYKEATAFCLPSLYEGFGLPILEAMSHEVAVVVGNTSSLPEVVGDAGVLVDPYSVDDLAHGLEKILSDKILREVLIKKGKERVKMFTWEKTAKETLAVLEEAYRN